MKEEPIPIIAGLSNDYADYVTTFEEYQVSYFTFNLFLTFLND